MLAHVHIMKTAGQTVRKILRQSFSNRHCDLLHHRHATMDDLRWAHRFYPNLASISGHHVVPFGELPTSGMPLRYFTFVREPLKRCVSHYQFSSPKKPNFPAFEKWLPERANFQTRILSGTQDARLAIEILEERIEFVGLVERFNESLVLLRSWFSDYPLDLRYQSVNVASNNNIKQSLLGNPKMVALIQELNEQDYEVYRYARDVIYPRQLAKFGPALGKAVADLEAELPGPTILSFQQFVASAKRNVFYKPLTRYLHKAA